jgi:hypothetical protein
MLYNCRIVLIKGIIKWQFIYFLFLIDFFIILTSRGWELPETNYQILHLYLIRKQIHRLKAYLILLS